CLRREARSRYQPSMAPCPAGGAGRLVEGMVGRIANPSHDLNGDRPNYFAVRSHVFQARSRISGLTFAAISACSVVLLSTFSSGWKPVRNAASRVEPGPYAR